MELLSVLAASRGTTEVRLANDYTVRQLMHMGEAHMKNQTFVLNLITAGLSGKGKGAPRPATQQGAKAEGVHENSTPGASGLPYWFRPKPGYRVVSMDAPMGTLMSAFSVGNVPGR